MRLRTPGPGRRVAVLLTVVGVICSLLVGQQPAHANVADVAVPQASWGAALRWAQTVPRSDFTCRMVARTTVGGAGFRIRLSNAFSGSAVTINAVSAGAAGSGASVTAPVAVRFGGSASVTIPAGGRVWSDRVDVPVGSDQDVAVSMYYAGSNPSVTQTPDSRRTGWCTASGAGNRTGDTAGTAFTGTGAAVSAALLWLDGLDVYRPASTGAVVALGDSITEGAATPDDSTQRWTDRFADRLLAVPGSPSVVNAGISGNTVCSNPASWGPGAVDRFGRDVTDQTGASTLLLFGGTNDLAYGGSDGNEVISSLRSVTASARAAGLRVVGATLIPRNAFTAAQERYRQQVNAWIRGTYLLDGYVDFDAAVRSESNPAVIASAYDGDGVHPNADGHAAMAAAIDLSLFTPDALTNGGFEAGSGTTATGWDTFSSSGKAAFRSDVRPRAGTWKAVHEDSAAYRAYTRQIVTGLTPGATYRLRAVVSSSGGQTVASIGVTSHGDGADHARDVGGVGSTWTNVEPVTFTVPPGSTSCEVYLYSEAGAGQWLAVDDMRLSRIS